LSRMAAGVGIYWGVSSLVGLTQSIILKREQRETTA
jgi:membrane protein insertase Oxa1/YidC/SpoIIIJ